ncbi:6-phosphofructokinase [Chloroflexota bacterium]
MRIGMLTGGGDVPGLNPCMRALVCRAVDEGCEVVGFRRGWEGLLFINPDDPTSLSEHTIQLDKQNTRTIGRTGGTFLHTSRTNPGSLRAEEVPDFLLVELADVPVEQTLDFTSHILRVLEYLEIDVLAPIGGDDTLAYGARLHAENIPVVAIPKTMDNDVFGTDYTIGFSTAITRSVELINILRTSSGSHERITVVELFGRNSGETCLMTSYLASVDRALIPEVPFDLDKLIHLLIEDRNNNPSRYAMVLISEGARFLDNRIIETSRDVITNDNQVLPIGRLTVELIKRKCKFNTLYQHLAYLMRSGVPDSLDLMVAKNYANLAMDLITERQYGRMVALQGGRYTHVAADTVTQGVKRVNVDEFYDAENYCPKVRSIEGTPMFLY